MYIVPQVKSFASCEKFVISGCEFKFDITIDKRVVEASKKVPVGDTLVVVKVADEGSEGYTLKLSEKEIELNAKSQAGAFYGISTPSGLLPSYSR